MSRILIAGKFQETNDYSKLVGCLARHVFLLSDKKFQLAYCNEKDFVGDPIMNIQATTKVWLIIMLLLDHESIKPLLHLEIISGMK